MNKPAIVNRSQAKALCSDSLAAPTMSSACDVIRRFAAELPASGWKRQLERLADGLEGERLAFMVFTKGNSKLPFYSFSALPEFTCPGAGSCLSWCYSFRAWRYPAAFARQLQNTLLLRHRKSKIAQELESIPNGSTVRLYVDGDFDSMSTLAFWFRMLNMRRDLNAYGYSKSLHLFAEWNNQGLQFPSNYFLNLSSGGLYDGGPIGEIVAGLDVARGRFVAVAVDGDWAQGFARYSDKTYHAAVRSAARAMIAPNAFSCPGQCGACLPNGRHACGDRKMVGVTIVIGVH